MYVQERIRPLESMGFGVSGRLGRPGRPAQASFHQRPTQQPGASLTIGRLISIEGAGIQASPTEMRASLNHSRVAPSLIIAPTLVTISSPGHRDWSPFLSGARAGAAGHVNAPPRAAQAGK